MLQRQVLFVFGAQMCVPEDPLRAAKEMGCRTIVMAEQVCCGSATALIDEFHRIRIDRLDEVVKLARRLDRIDGVVSYDDQAVPVVAHIASAIGLRGNSIAAAITARDKYSMKMAFQSAGIPIARYTLASSENDAVDWAGSNGYPVVVKPVRGAASQGVIRADCDEGLREAYRRVLKTVRSYGLDIGMHSPSSLLVEEYLSGAEISVELFIDNHEPEPICVFEKPQALDGPYFEETIYVTPARLDLDLTNNVRALACQASKAIGLRDGPAHCEIRLAPGGPRVLEINARLIGGACSRVFQYVLGDDIHKYVVKRALGDPFELPPQIPGRAAGAVMLPIPREGRLRSIDGIEKARKIAGVEDIIISAETGQVVVPFPEQSCYLGFVTAVGKSTREVEESLQHATRSIRLNLDPIACETWSRRLTVGELPDDLDRSGIESLDGRSLSEARAIVMPILATAQFGELPEDLAFVRAAECVDQLLTGSLGKSSPANWFVAEGCGVILSVASDRSPGSCSIACFGVVPEARRSGIGTALVRTLISQCVSEGYDLLTVVVDPRDPVATTTYRGLGFAPEETCPPLCCSA